MNFSVSIAARRAAEDALMQQAIKAWQARAQNAAEGFGVPVVAAGTRVDPDHRRVRSAADDAHGGGGRGAQSAPVATEAGTSDISVTVSGEAILDSARGR
jgi:predicted secreted protein